MRNNFQITVEGRREGPVCEKAMEGLGKLLPKRFVVLAKNQAQFKDFMQVIQRSVFDGIYADEPDRVRGLQDPVVVCIGNYFEADSFVDVSKVLDTRGRITSVTVTDWR